MKELTLINNEGANLKIRRYQYTLNKGFDIIDQWGVVCKNMNMEEVINWLDGRSHIDDSQENRWIWTEQGKDSRTSLFKVIHFLITPQLR